MHFKTFWTKINFFDCYLNEIYFKNTDFISETQRKGKTRGGRRRKKKRWESGRIRREEEREGTREKEGERERPFVASLLSYLGEILMGSKDPAA